MARPKLTRKAGAKRREVGFAVVGLGHTAQAAVLPAFENTRSSAKLVALVSGDPKKQQKLGKRYGVPVFDYADYEACLALPEVEAVYLALPNVLHREYTVRAAKAGVHVLCEKPMATRASECEEMIAACHENGVRLMIAYRLHFEEANLWAVDAVRKGKLGDPRVFDSTFSFQLKAPNIRLQKDQGGGALWDIGIYCVNAARALFRAEPIEVMALTGHGRDERFSEVEEAASCTLRFPDDRLATFCCSFGAEATARYQLLGTKGVLAVDNAYEYQGKIEARLATRSGKTKKKTVSRRDQFGPELEAFARCIIEGKDPEPNGWEGLADVRILEALYRSAAERRPIELPAFEKTARPTRDQELSFPAVKEPKLVHVEPPAQE